MAALSGSISKRYARALFQLGVDNGKFQDFGRELLGLAELYRGSADLRQTLESPVFKPSEKKAVLETILSRTTQSQEMHRFVILLLQRGRLPLLPNIARDFQRMTDDRLGQVRGQLTSAVPLDAADFARIQQALEKRTGRKVILESHVDPELLGGVVAQVGDLVLDGSLRSRLQNLSQRIMN